MHNAFNFSLSRRGPNHYTYCRKRPNLSERERSVASPIHRALAVSSLPNHFVLALLSHLTPRPRLTLSSTHYSPAALSCSYLLSTAHPRRLSCFLSLSTTHRSHLYLSERGLRRLQYAFRVFFSRVLFSRSSSCVRLFSGCSFSRRVPCSVSSRLAFVVFSSSFTSTSPATDSAFLCTQRDPRYPDPPTSSISSSGRRLRT